MYLFEIVTAAIVILSVINFVLYGVDKARAVRGEWRIPEKTLLLLSLFGGGIGGLFAMILFRHKTKHASFMLVNALGVIWQSALIVFLALNT